MIQERITENFQQFALNALDDYMPEVIEEIFGFPIGSSEGRIAISAMRQLRIHINDLPNECQDCQREGGRIAWRTPIPRIRSNQRSIEISGFGSKPFALGEFNFHVDNTHHVLAPAMGFPFENGEFWRETVVGAFANGSFLRDLNGAAGTGQSVKDFMLDQPNSNFSGSINETYGDHTFYPTPDSLRLFSFGAHLFDYFLGYLSFAVGYTLLELGWESFISEDLAFYEGLQDSWTMFVNEIERLLDSAE